MGLSQEECSGAKDEESKKHRRDQKSCVAAKETNATCCPLGRGMRWRNEREIGAYGDAGLSFLCGRVDDWILHQLEAVRVVFPRALVIARACASEGIESRWMAHGLLGGGTAEEGHVAAGPEIYLELAAVLGLMIVLSDALANLAGGKPDHGIQICVVVVRPLEDSDPEVALFEESVVTGKCLLDQIAEQVRITPAVAEERALKHPLQLAEHGLTIGIRGWMPLDEIL